MKKALKNEFTARTLNGLAIHNTIAKATEKGKKIPATISDRETHFDLIRKIKGGLLATQSIEMKRRVIVENGKQVSISKISAAVIRGQELTGIDYSRVVGKVTITLENGLLMKITGNKEARDMLNTLKVGEKINFFSLEKALENMEA